MRLIFALTIMAIALFVSGCGQCDPNPKPGTCALQTCGNEDDGNYQQNYECRGPDDERWGWECHQDGGPKIHCETFD